MSLPVVGRFTVASLLQTLERDHAGGSITPVGDEPIQGLLHWFRSECASIVASCPPEAVPLRLPKARIGDLLGCERGTLARLGETGLTEPMVRGRLIDRVVAQHLSAGLGAGPDDLQQDLRDCLTAAGASDVLSWLDEADEETAAKLWRGVGKAAAGLHDSWGEIPRRWWARSQERVAIEVADGVLLLSAQFDLALGGPPTDLPAVIVEVKAGSAADRNRRDLLWYGLLYALRHGRAPAVVATWTAADDGLVPVPVTVGSLEAAARRGLAALERLVGLAGGRDPEVTPHGGCPWCPELDRCQPGLTSVAGAPSVAQLRGPVGEPEWDPAEDEPPWD